MAFKINPPYIIDNTPIYNVGLEEGVLGKADRNGSILINQDIKDPKQIEDTINHEQVHIEQMASGELDYDEKNVYWKGKKYPRSKFNEANKKLPWEIEAYKAG